MKNKKKLFVHIGVDKTGSTSIQTFFRKYEKELRKKKVHYFSNKFGNLYHFKIKALFQDAKSSFIENSLKQDQLDRSIIKKQIIQEIKSNIIMCDTFIISHEDIFHYTENDYERLVVFFSEYFDEITPIFYMREYVAYFISKKTHKLKTFFGADRNFYLNAKVYNYSDIINKLNLCFKKITYGIYDKENLYNNNVIFDFLQKCELNHIIKDQSFDKNIYVNVNLDTKSLINLYFLNKHLNILQRFNLKRLRKIIFEELDSNKGRGIKLSKKEVNTIKMRTQEYEKILYEQYKIKFKDFNSYGPYTFSKFNLILGFLSFTYFFFKILIYYLLAKKIPFIDN